MITYVLGPSCAGKSTWVQETRAANDIVFDFDKVAMSLGGAEEHTHTGPVMDVTFAARDAVEAKVLDGVGAAAFIIRSNLTESEIKELGAAGVRFAVIDPGKDVALARAAKERPEWAIERINQWYENPPAVPDEFVYKESESMTRSADLTGKDGLARRTIGAVTRSEGGSFTGLAISYTEAYETEWFIERFEIGCVQDEDKVPVLRDHNMSNIVGRVSSAEDTSEGRVIDAAITTTPLGEETRTLLNDGTLSGISVGFKPLQWREEYLEGEDRPVIIHERIEVFEYSLTAFPAYKTAQVSQSRSISQEKENNMDPETLTRSDLEAVTQGMTELFKDFERRAEAGEFFTTSQDETPAFVTRAAAFESFGDMVKALSNASDTRNDEALQLYRDITTADIPSHLVNTPGWIGDLTREIVARRPWTNTFDQDSLPAKGMTVDYGKTSQSAEVAKQERELAPLAKGANFRFEKFSAPVETYGGANTVSQQVIDRSESWVINDMLRAMGLAYGAQSEAAVKAHAIKELDALLVKHKADADAGHAVDVPTDFGAFDWIDAVVDAAGIFEDRNYDMTGLAISKDIFKKLAREAGTDGRPLLTLHGTGVNVVGELNLPKSYGNLLGMPVRVLHGVTNRGLFFDPIAIRTLESPGAPFHLQDQNVLNLSQDFSIYGYMAHLTPYPDALLGVNFTA